MRVGYGLFEIVSIWTVHSHEEWSGELKPRFYGPFKVSWQVGEVGYEHELPTSSRVHNVFHVSILEKELGHNMVPTS